MKKKIIDTILRINELEKKADAILKEGKYGEWEALDDILTDTIDEVRGYLVSFTKGHIDEYTAWDMVADKIRRNRIKEILTANV